MGTKVNFEPLEENEKTIVAFRLRGKEGEKR